jgi:transposase
VGVVIGVDPHKASVTIEVRDEREILLATGQFATTKAGYRQLVGYVRQWPERIWAVEGANGVGRPLAARLLADGQAVVDVPASWPPGYGSSTPGRAARPTRPPRTRW